MNPEGTKIKLPESGNFDFSGFDHTIPGSGQMTNPGSLKSAMKPKTSKAAKTAKAVGKVLYNAAAILSPVHLPGKAVERKMGSAVKKAVSRGIHRESGKAGKTTVGKVKKGSSNPELGEIHKGGKGYTAKVIMKVKRPEGDRRYFGKGSSKGIQMAVDKAQSAALFKSVKTPADSVRTRRNPKTGELQYAPLKRKKK